MRLRAVAFLLLTLISVTTAHAAPVHLWSLRYGDSDDQYVNSCVADPFGNVLICGSFYSTINITEPFTSFGRRDAIVAKFSPSGTPIWSKRIGYMSVDNGLSAVSDYSGNTVVVGSVGMTVESRTAYIARFTPLGDQLWIKYFVSSPDSSSSVNVVATDAQKNILVAGRFTGNINLGGSTLFGQAQNDMFLAKFDAAGNHKWSKSFTNGGNFSEVAGIGVDPSGQPVITGNFGGTTTFGSGTLISTSDYDIFVAKFAENGAPLWSKRFGQTVDHEVEDVVVDASGRIVLTGQSWGNIDFGGGTLTPVAGPDLFLATLEPDGDHVWSKMFGGPSNEYGIDVSIASNTDVLLTAYAFGGTPFTFGGAMFTAQVTFGDMFVARFFVAGGNHRWSTKFSGTGGNTYGFIDEVDGQLVLGGAIGANTNFGGSSLQHQGAQDIFVARFGDQLTAAGPTLARASLAQNTPNPFNPQTNIEYTLTSPARAVIEIFDASGTVVARLDEGDQPAGTYSTTWNARDANGHAVASGVYFYRIAGMPDVAARKMVLLK